MGLCIYLGRVPIFWPNGAAGRIAPWSVSGTGRGNGNDHESDYGSDHGSDRGSGPFDDGRRAHGDRGSVTSLARVGTGRESVQPCYHDNVARGSVTMIRGRAGGGKSHDWMMPTTNVEGRAGE